MRDLLETLLVNGSPADPKSVVALVQAHISSLDAVASAVGLQDVKAIHNGIGLKTNGSNNGQMDTCDDIMHNGLALLQAHSDP
eukprot:scaffold15973_cov137-Isochrysis_galbana.AAC.5